MAKLSLVNMFDDLMRSSAVLSEGIEKEFIKIVFQQEECRKRWGSNHDEISELRKENAKLKADNESLLVQLKHTRFEQEKETKRRQQAENAQQQLESQVALIKELLNDENARNRLKENEVQLLTQISHQYNEPIKISPVKRPRESNVSQLSPTYSEIDYTDDDLDENVGRTSLLRNGKVWKTGNTVPKEDFEEEETPPKKLRKSYSAADAMIPISEMVSPPVNPNGLGNKSISAVCLKPELNVQNRETPKTGSKPRHQQVQRLSQQQPQGNGKVTPQSTRGTPNSANRSRTPGNGKKNHDFVSKTVLKPESCKPCGKLIRFARMALKCRDCRVICHTDCKRLVPAPCIPVKRTPNTAKKQEENIEFYAPSVSPRIPTIVLRCVQELERRGLNQVGLYRIPGTETRVREIKNRFLEGRGSPDLTKETDENVICGVLKAFLKQLSEPLLTFALHQRFIESSEGSNGDDALVFQAVSELPAANRDTLAFLMVHLQKVAQNKECKMPVSNIAKVFAPTLVGYSCKNPEPVLMLSEVKTQPKVLEKLLNLPADYWNQFLHVHEENIRSPPYNPNTHNADGTPKTPKNRNDPACSMLGPARSDTPDKKSIKKKGSVLGRTPLTPRFGSKSKNPTKRPHHFFDSPMLK